LGIPRAGERWARAPRTRGKPDTMLWTILVIIVIILAVIGFFTVVRGRA
jgi:hypothetical protein